MLIFDIEPLNSISKRILKLQDLVVSANIKVELHDDIRVGIWSKFMLICAVSGVGAVTRAPMGGKNYFFESSRFLIQPRA